MKKYTLKITEQQARIISLALDVYSRLEGGQLEWAFSMISWKNRENLEQINPLLKDIKQLLTGVESGNLGISQVSQDARNAYDLHQVIRHRLAWDANPNGGITVNFDNPRHYGNEPLASIAKDE